MDSYLWIKSLHVIAVMSWMAGLLYLPRLFVYHANSIVGSGQSETFKTMERRLLKAIMLPAMLVVWVSGLYLAWRGGYLASGWFHVKLLLVLAMSGMHGMSVGLARAFAEDRNKKTALYFRYFNEVPTLLMVGIVILVIGKPF